MDRLPRVTHQTLNRIGEFLDQVMDSFPLPGLAVGVVYKDELVLTRGLGVKSIGSIESVTPDSLFHLASISKTFVATAILQLVEMSKLDLHEPLVTYLPEFKMAGESYKTITIQQMLSHTSGLPDIEEYLFDQPEVDDLALQRFVYSLGDKELVFLPGEKFYYSNTAYDILGYLIAQVSGLSFESYIEEYLLHPLGMEHSTFLKSAVSTGLATTPYLSLPDVELSPVYPYHRAHAPSGSLHSSVNELSHWAIANLYHGLFDGKTIWQPAIQELLWQPVIAWSDDDPEDFEALSWFTGKYKGLQTYSHSGGDVGFCTYLVLIPEKSLAVIVLANTFPAPVKEISNSIIDLILGNEAEPLKPPVMVPLSQVLTSRGSSAAFDVYRQLVEDLPNQFDDSSEQFCDMAYILTEIKRIPEAMRMLELAVKIHPEADDVYNMLAFASYKDGRHEQAIQYARRCLELNPKNSEAAVLYQELQQM